MIYLASPHSSPDEGVMLSRFLCACKVAAWLFKQGELVFSPIAHSHYIAVFGNNKAHYNDWRRFDEHMIDLSDKIIVAKIEGWNKSFGIMEEIKYAERTGKPVEYLDVENILKGANENQ
jgi:nucleoside 2-deoxyribosyltransferase